MKKVVLSVELYDERGKKRALRAVSGLQGVDSISMDMRDKKLTVIGDIDPVTLASKLRKLYQTQIFSVGPPPSEPELSQSYSPTMTQSYSPFMTQSYSPTMIQHYYVSEVEDPNGCVIC